jgi:cob(I)alamin adenosyltransferase
MKIYTKTGDRGETSLFGGGRVKKNDARVSAYGEVDELNSFVGVLISQIEMDAPDAPQPEKEAIRMLLKATQNRLFDLGAELAVGDENFLQKLSRRIALSDIEALESEIDRMQTSLKPLKNFILPGGCATAAHAHVCRSVSRRAERAMLASPSTAPLLIAYINRLSDYFFVLARYLNHLSGTAEPEWEK